MRLFLPVFLVVVCFCAALVSCSHTCGGGTLQKGDCQPYYKDEDGNWHKNENSISKFRENVIDSGPVGDEGCDWVCKRHGHNSGCCGWYDDVCWCS